jgi:hypothetical protein
MCQTRQIDTEFGPVRGHDGCIRHTRETICSVSRMLVHNLLVALFVTTAGLTASGIVANAYRLAKDHSTAAANRAVYLAVMVLAGPSVLLENAARARRKKECSTIAFFLAAAVTFYWSLALGLFVVSVALAL